MFDAGAIERIIEDALRRKLNTYNPEPAYMPFHTSLLGKDRMAVYSFIQSLNTNFGTAIFEQVAKGIATEVFEIVELQRRVDFRVERGRNSASFSSGAQDAVTTIMNGLSTAETAPNHAAEMAQVAELAQSGQPIKKKLPIVDVFLHDGNKMFLIDLKTVKPNKGNGNEYKRTLMEWASAVMYRNPGVPVETIIAMPYNPYHPQPYHRWTLVSMLENGRQLLVAEEFWNFLAGGEDIYQDLLDCFERVGLRMRGEIDLFFETIGERKYV